MAEAPEEIHIQSAVVCDTCENTAEHFCKTCHDKLCNKCKGIHARSKSSFDHDVTQLTFDSLSLSAELPSPQVCRSHPGFRANVCCRECEIPVCEKCLTGEHNGHKLVDTQELFLEKKKKVKQKFAILESELPKYQAKLLEIKKIEKKRNERQGLLESQIIAHIEDVKSKLESEKNLLLRAAKYKTEIEQLSLKVQESQVLCHMKNIRSFVTEFKDESTERNTFILYANTANGSALPERFPYTLSPCIPQFSKGIEDENLMRALLGRISLNTKGIHLQEFLEVGNILIGNEPIKYLAYQLNDDTFWVFCQGENMYKKCNRSGTLLNNIKTNTNAINNPICVLPNGQIFIRKDTHIITQVNQNLEESVFVDLKSESPICIFSPQDEEGVVLGIVNSKLTEGKILRFDVRKKCTQEIKNRHLFQYIISQQVPSTQPTHIAENINGDICISNTNVDVFNRYGDFKFSYSGSRKKKILPGGICTDVLGNILVADKNYCCVHILDIDGQFIMRSGILRGENYYPVTLAIDVNYCLCVGCSDGRIRVFKYLA